MTRLTRVPRPSPRFAFWGLAAIALLVSHDAIWSMQVGPGEQLAEALRQAGHDYWGPLSLLIVAVGVILATACVVRLASLRRQANALGRDSVSADQRSYLRRAGTTWLRLFAVVTVIFAAQENAEHWISHGGHLPGTGALLGPEYPLALPVLAAITFVAAVVAAAVRRAEALLLARITAASRPPRPPRRTPRPTSWARPHGLARIRANPGRAPPDLLVHA